MELLGKILDTIEVDCPSLHVEGAVPILDLMMRVNNGKKRQDSISRTVPLSGP